MGIYPLSEPQKLIYDLSLFAGGSVANVAASVLFEGKVDKVALEKAVHHILKNNDIFNIKVLPDASQTIKEYEDKEIPHKHFSSADEFHAWAGRLAHEPIDIYGDLFEITIITVADKYFGTFVSFHHIIFDAWSAALYASKLYAYYTDFKGGKTPEVDTFPYLDYLESEKKYLDSPKYIKDKAYWNLKFEGFNEPVFLSEKTVTNIRADRLDYTLSKDETSKLRDFATKNGLSVYSLFITAMAVYIARIKDATTFQIGTTVLNRSSKAEKNSLGMFVNTLALPVSLDMAKGFLENAKNTSLDILPALRHQKYNYSHLLKDIQKNHNYSGKLYDVLINYQNARVAGMDEDFMATYWYHCGMQPESLQIQINDRDNTGELYISYDYQVEKFSEAEIKQLHDRLMTILSNGIDDDQKDIARLDIVPAKERTWLVSDLNQTDHDLPDLLCIHKFFEAEVLKRPDHVAMVYDRTAYSYKELNSLAEQVADFLRAKNIKNGAVVALILERCAEMMPIILGALKAGCTYMPISTSLPRDRVDYMLENSKAALVFYQAQFKDRFNPQTLSAEVGEIWNLPEPLFNTESASNPNEVAYILYTSGSTGRPKGVQIEHHSVCNRLLWMHDKFPLDGAETLIQKTNYAFDVSVWELFWAFMTGRTLLVPPPGVERDPERLIEYIAYENVKKIHFVPSMLSVFLDYIEATNTRVPQLAQVIVSGEALTPSLNRRFYKLFSSTGASLHNLYGPTECTVDVLYYDCNPDDDEIPIGRPVWNTKAFVVDKNYQLLPQGVEGELAISGVLLARGYVDISLNEGTFVEGTDFGRIYMTGDKAMVRPDGEILYLGRNDDQIKIRGQRVELTDIEEGLLSKPYIGQVAVLFDSDQLIAFYKSEKTFSNDEFADHLGKILPSYMIPFKYVRVDDFPLNANGKLARRELLRLAKETEVSHLRANGEIDLPATEQERQILAAVSKQLGRDDLSVNENLLQAGLTSLQIISVISDLSTLGTSLKVNDFYTLETIREIAENTLISRRPIIHTYNPTEGDTAIICLPYGGGSFGSFAAFATRLYEKFNLPLIAVQSAHVNPDEILKKLATLPYKNLYVLGVCVGTGLAIELAGLLEKSSKINLKGLYLISSIPPFWVRPFGRFFNPWKFSSDSVINSYLQNLSEKEFRLGKEEISLFRDDVGYFLKYLAKNSHTRLGVPVRLIYGANDPMIKEKHTKTLWQKRFKKQISVSKIEDAKHYIIHTHIDEILNLIAPDFKVD